MKQVAFTIADFCNSTRVGRTTAFKLIKIGELRAVKLGRRTLVLEEDLNRWLASLPQKSSPPKKG